MITMTRHLFRVIAPNFVCGVITDRYGTIIETAPKLDTFLGQHARNLDKWVRSIGGHVEHVGKIEEKSKQGETIQ